MIKIYSIVLMLLAICFCENTFAQTYYYALTKKIEDGNYYTNTAGGQFITFDKNNCFDSDKYGVTVKNGTLTLYENYGGPFKNYIGNSYFGNVIYRFKTDLSTLNIIVNRNLIYVYKRTTPPSGVTTCTLIKSKSSSSSSSGTTSGYIATPTYNDGWNNTQPSSTYESTTPTPTPRQKTKVRNKCPYCTNGERIPHESVSTFGVDGPRVYCSICNKYFSYGTVHAHHKCNYCDGKGYTEYEY